MKSPIPSRAAVAAAALAVAAGLCGACVERKMLIRSDPPGALITLDGETLDARTPAEVPFDFGGTRAVTLTAPGHKVLEATAKLEDPWFMYFPLDIAAEFLWFGTIEDVQTFDYPLQAYRPYDQAVTPAEREAIKRKLSELKVRAAEFRAGGSEGPATQPK